MFFVIYNCVNEIIYATISLKLWAKLIYFMLKYLINLTLYKRTNSNCVLLFGFIA